VILQDFCGNFCAWEKKWCAADTSKKCNTPFRNFKDQALLFSFSEEKRSKKGTFLEVLGISSLQARRGLCPSIPQTFEKV